MTRQPITILAVIIVAVNLLIPNPSLYGWNDRTHMLIAYLAYKDLSPTCRDSIAATLREHPHFESYLRREKPENCPEDLWVFMRAATWPDFVNRDEFRADFHRGKWHYVNNPYIPVRSKLPLSSIQPPPLSPNILSALDECFDVLVERYPSPAKKAIAITWIEHLVGDIHQPLHCVNLYCDKFPSGDQGGNRIAVRDGDKVTKLHAYWDNLFGEERDFESISALANEFTTTADSGKPLEWDAWASDSGSLARKHVYLNGELPLTEWRKEMQDGVMTEEVPTLTAEYSKNAKEISREQVKLASRRLADVLMNAMK